MKELEVMVGEVIDVERLVACEEVAFDAGVMRRTSAKIPLTDSRFLPYHTRILNYWLTADCSAEKFLTLFERCANQLMLKEPAMLLTLANAILDSQLHSSVKQWAAYFLGVTQRRLQKYSAAVDAFDALLAQKDVPLRLRGRTLNSRAATRYYQGDYQSAFDGYQTSITLLEHCDDPRSLGSALLNLGFLQYELRQYDSAEKSLHRARAQFVAANAPSWVASVDNELGLIERDRGNWQTATKYFQRFIAYNTTVENWDYVAFGLNNLGEVQLFQNELETARKTLQEAEKRMVSETFLVDVQLNLGVVAQLKQEVSEAKKRHQAALKLAQKIGRNDNLPAIYLHLGEATQSVEWLLQSIDAVEESWESARTEQIKVALLGRWQQPYETLFLHHATQDNVAAAFNVAERARARTFAHAVGSTTLTTQQQLQSQLGHNTLALIFFTTGVLDTDLPLIKQLAPTLREKLFPPAHTFCFVISYHSAQLINCGIDPNAFVATGVDRHDPDRWLLPAVQKTVYNLLFHLDASPDTLFIIPHGPLHYLPLSAIVHTQASDSPLIQFAPSATLLINTPTAQTHPSRLYCGVAHAGFPPLRLTAHEIKAAASSRNSQTWLDGVDDKNELKTVAESARWLHFACHGWFNEDEPLDSYLHIGNGVRLTAKEVLTWSLSAELVVLSACSTGTSRILRGDEPMGLVRAFLQAGAQTVLVTQWEVEDVPTYLLMSRFFERLDAENQIVDALQQAQAWLRSVDSATLNLLLPSALALPKSPHPFHDARHWAGFTLWGRQL